MLIEINNLKFTYPGQAKAVLNIQNFSVKKGEKVFLYGPSGTGKSTFLECLAGVLKPDSGSLKILNQDLTTLNSSQRDLFRALHIGYIFQSFNLIPYLTVRENIMLPLQLSPQRREKLGNVDIDMVVKGLCGNLNILDILEKNVSELSVGQQQRVAVARALLGKPDVLLADEPTSALDSDLREQFLKLLFELSGVYGTTVIFVSHDRSIEILFDRSVALSVINEVEA